MKACLHRKKFCKQKILCTLTIPDNSVRLRKLSKRKKPQHKSVGCSQTQWVWSVLNNQTGNLNLKLRNKDWVSMQLIKDADVCVDVRVYFIAKEIIQSISAL